MKKKKCTNPELGTKIGLEIVFNLGAKRDICLTHEQSLHLAACAECNEFLPVWFKKGEFTYLDVTATNIEGLARIGDPRVLKKTTMSGQALFLPNDEDCSKGMMVEIDQRGGGLAFEMSREDFERLE